MAAMRSPPSLWASSKASYARCSEASFAVRHINVPFASNLDSAVKMATARKIERFLCRAEGSSGCCGGKSSSGGSCGDHKVDPAVAGVGKEFEALVASKTMEEFEMEYETGQMTGLISRDVVKDVVNILPEANERKTEERFIDIDEVLAEATELSNGEFVFVDSEFEDMIV